MIPGLCWPARSRSHARGALSPYSWGRAPCRPPLRSRRRGHAWCNYGKGRSCSRALHPSPSGITDSAHLGMNDTPVLRQISNQGTVERASPRRRVITRGLLDERVDDLCRVAVRFGLSESSPARSRRSKRSLITSRFKTSFGSCPSFTSR